MKLDKKAIFSRYTAVLLVLLVSSVNLNLIMAAPINSKSATFDKVSITKQPIPYQSVMIHRTIMPSRHYIYNQIKQQKRKSERYHFSDCQYKCTKRYVSDFDKVKHEDNHTTSRIGAPASLLATDFSKHHQLVTRSRSFPGVRLHDWHFMKRRNQLFGNNAVGIHVEMPKRRLDNQIR
ncbi:hypothetical protein FBU30_005323 [Linnemannia zychae]|nr:hypothetical protein FBU30_005323 [Linnemannia zychae]